MKIKTQDLIGPTLAQELNEACLEACGRDIGTELVRGQSVNVAKLHKRGIAAVIRYWRDTDTIGGSLLWKYSYRDNLATEHIDVFKRADRIIEHALNTAFGWCK